MKACLLSLVLMICWSGASSAFASDIIIENNRWNSFTSSECCSSDAISTIYRADQAISIAQKSLKGLNLLAEANLGALKLTSLTSDDALPLPSINADQPSFLRKALTVYVTAESIPEPALLLMLGMSLLGVSRLIHLSRKHKGKRSAGEAQRY